MNWAQWALVVLLVIGFFRTVREDFEGKPAKEPMGFAGFVGSVIAFGSVMWLYWMAGLFTPHQ